MISNAVIARMYTNVRRQMLITDTRARGATCCATRRRHTATTTTTKTKTQIESRAGTTKSAMAISLTHEFISRAKTPA